MAIMTWIHVQYQRRLEILVVTVMVVMMLLYGLSFLVAPNASVFARFDALGIHVTPIAFSVMCFIGMIGYPILLSRDVRKLAADIKQELFILYSFPILLYFIILAIDQITRQMALTPVIYFSIYALILILPFAIYKGYRRWLEWVCCGALCVLMLVTGVLLSESPINFLARFNDAYSAQLTPQTFAILFGLCSFGYFLTPFVRRLRFQRRVFILLSAPILIFALTTLVTVQSGATFIGSLAVINLECLIILIGVALYRNDSEVKGKLDAASP